MNHAIVDTVVTHTVRGSDLDELNNFAQWHIAEGYQAAEPWAALGNVWMLQCAAVGRR
ncbi:hypothetical protein [Nocardia wallacei]|uniref:hypothetical protein n=1 Tax=Nocardia wallacei TaxID=480035 RepID=UPI002456345F|nr:hypothetical protein [Nocardia wallacei]